MHREPARLLGALAGVLVLVADLVQDLTVEVAEVPTWSAALPVITGFLLRRFVYAPATVDQLVFKVPDDPRDLVDD
jgi:hypothetical protein